ncbi:hypothetical protein C8J57DRAFT_1224679 [Mycena rebaudengoi]|nr:hypothetical protein C8J57DRAFT_1224679 [Mycena rebaudengoi]
MNAGILSMSRTQLVHLFCPLSDSQFQIWQYQEAIQAAKDDVSGHINGMKGWESMPLADWAHRKSTDYDIGKSPVLMASAFARYGECRSEQADNDLRIWCSWDEWVWLRGGRERHAIKMSPKHCASVKNSLRKSRSYETMAMSHPAILLSDTQQLLIGASSRPQNLSRQRSEVPFGSLSAKSP